MVFDFTKLMEAANKNKAQSKSAGFDDRIPSTAKSKPSVKPQSSSRSADKVSSNAGVKKTSSTTPQSKSSSSDRSKNSSSGDSPTKSSNDRSFKPSSSNVSSKIPDASKSTSSSHSSLPSSSKSKIDPARVAEYLKKKQMQEQEEERRRTEEKRRLFELRATKDKEKSIKRKFDGGTTVEKKIELSKPADVKKSMDTSKSISGKKDAKSEQKSRSHGVDEPAAKRLKLDSNQKKAPPAPSADFARLMEVAGRNRQLFGSDDEEPYSNLKRPAITHSSNGKSLPPIPKKSSSGPDPSRKSMPKLPATKQNGVIKDKSSLPSTSTLHKSKSTPTLKDSTSRSALSSTNNSSSKVSSSKSQLSTQGKSDPKSKAASSNLQKSAAVQSKKPTAQSAPGTSKSDPVNAKARPEPTPAKKAPLMAKSMASATMKSAMLTSRSTANSCMPAVKSAKLISAPIFDAPRDERAAANAQKPTSISSSLTRQPIRPAVATAPKLDQQRPIQQRLIPTLTPSSSRQPVPPKRAGLSQAELFNRKQKLKLEEERARLLAIKKLSSNPNWEEDDDEDDDDEEEYDSEMDDFIDDNPVDSDQEDYSEHIKSLFGYDRSKYRFIDDDDDPNMESNYTQIQKEEAYSARAGLKEDLEEFEREQQMMARKKKKARM